MDWRKERLKAGRQVRRLAIIPARDDKSFNKDSGRTFDCKDSVNGGEEVESTKVSDSSEVKD